MKTVLNFIVFLYLLFLFSCGNQKYSDTPTYGEATVSADESYQPLIEAERDAFEGIYTNAKIHIRIGPEGDVINDLLSDSARFVIMSRELNAEEKKYFESKQFHPVTTKIASDALALIVNRDNSLNNITYSHLQGVFSGKITNWQMLDSSSSSGKIKIVFDNKKSGNARFIMEKFLNGKPDFPEYCFAVNANPQVIDYVMNDKNTMGIIGVNWLSDKEDSTARSFLKKVKVLAVSSKENPNEYFQPYQAYISLMQYPLTRDVFIVNREGRTGLGTGFAAFIAGEKGQRIVLLAGLLPATMPVRIVNVKTE
jgi:phosphate transport system substrate-binding protein